MAQAYLTFATVGLMEASSVTIPDDSIVYISSRNITFVKKAGVFKQTGGSIIY